MKENMDDGDIELSSDHIKPPNSEASSNIQASSFSSYSFLDDLLRNSQTCSHTHTCNPPGPDATHTHTCYHTHTHVFPSEEDGILHDEQSPVSKPRLGNREAVRKYREKKKAHAKYLEDEVKKLRLVNQGLMRKLQRQAVLEKEVVRLRTLLLDLRGKIDYELGDFPFGKQCDSMSSFSEGECRAQMTSVSNLACNFDGSSFPSNVMSGCGKTASLDCEANMNYIQRDSVDK